VFEQVAQLPGLILGVLIAGGLTYLLWHEPLPTIGAAAIGGWVGSAIIRALCWGASRPTSVSIAPW